MPPVRDFTVKLFKLITLVIAAAILAALCLKVGLADMMARLRQAAVPLVAAAAGLSLPEETLKAWRWRYILRILGCRIAYREVLFLIFANLPLRGVASSHAGDLSKAAYLKRWQGTSLFTSVSSMLVELALSLLSLLAIMAAGCLASGTNPHRLLHTSALGLLVASLFLYVSRFGAWRAWILGQLRPMGSAKGVGAVDQALSGYAQSGLKEAAALAVSSLALETGKLISFFLLSRAVGVFIPPQDILVFLPAVMIAAKLPFTPTGLGTREAAILFLFKDRAGADALLGVGVLFSFAEYVAPMLLGLPLVKLTLDRILVGRSSPVSAAEGITPATPSETPRA